MITTPQEIYNTSAWYQYNRTLAYDMTEMFEKPLSDDIKKLILFNILYCTYRNFQEPALRFFNIQGRTKLIKLIRGHDVRNATTTILYKICTGSYPKDSTAVDNFIKSNDLSNEYGIITRYWISGNVANHIDTIDKISEVLDYTSVYEWLSMFANDENNNLNFLLANFKRDFGYINKVTGKNIQSIRKPFNIIVTDHVALANKLIAMGERDAP